MSVLSGKASARRLLVTTAERRTWRSDRPLLFAGNWCRLPEERAAWEELDAEVMLYHWDDRAKLHADYPYLQSCYEGLLAELAAVLNARHGTAHSTRYWRILVGPWLYLFIHVLFDRWTMARLAADRGDVTGTILLADPEDELIPRDLRGMSPDDLRWNHFLYACAIREQGRIPFEEVPGERRGLMQDSATADPVSGIGQSLRRWVRAVLEKTVRRDEPFFITTYLPKNVESRLQLAFGSVPKFWRSPAPPQVPPDLGLRAALVLPQADKDEDAFRRFLAKMVPRQIPTVYLEGYAALRDVVGRLPWPARPKVIFTSNSFQFDEVFQAWAAAKTAEGAPLVIGQHGGFYGVGRVVAGEDHQVEIADRFLTWGWKDARLGVYPLFALGNLGTEAGEWRPDGDLLLVTVPIRPVSFKCHSWAIAANQSQAFVEDQLRFAATLTPAALGRLVLRIHKRTDDKLRTGYIPQWRAAFPQVEIDPSVGHIHSRFASSRLVVITYNGTTFLETLGRNIPTLILWNPAHWELRAEAEPYFRQLADAGIFYADPTAAALHVNEIWDDVAGWWYSSAVQSARKAFCAQYARASDDPHRDLLAALTFP